MITVMAVVGTVLLNNVFRFYTDEFSGQMEKYFSGDLRSDLIRAMDAVPTGTEGEYGFAREQKSILAAYGFSLGIDDYRNYYILDMDGNVLESSNEALAGDLPVTPNILSAMSRTDGTGQLIGSSYTDYAVYLKGDSGRECIIYIKDTQEEMQQLSWRLFSIILQAVFFGLIIAIILSFFLAKAITSPIQSLTQGAQLIASGNLEQEIDVHSRDEIGTLTNTFNHMGRVLKHTLEEVSGERQKLATVFSYLKDGVIAFSDGGQVININKSAKQIFGEAYGPAFTLDGMLSLLSVEYARAYIQDLTRENSCIIRDVEYQGKVFDINIGILRYIEDNASHNGCIVVTHDITSRYELDKAQREFVANVSHELRTPLTNIRGAVETVLLNPDISQENRDFFLNMAIDVSDSMLNILNDLLTLSRLDDQRTQWNVTTFDMKQTLCHLCEIMRAGAASHHHTITFDDRAELPLITGDKDRLEQVIINIVSNAIKYTPDNGRIDIRAIPGDDNDIRIQVRDNGIGIPKEDIPRLFERFYRVDKSRTAESGGTGLGLAIAKEIVEAHGGDIEVRSRVGVGTLVTITLPIECHPEGGENRD